MSKGYRELLDAARIIRTANPDVVKRLRQDKSNGTTGNGYKKKKNIPKDMFGKTEYIFKHKGRWVIDTAHATDRMAQRNHFTKNEIEFFFRKMIEAYLKKGPRYVDMDIFSGANEFLFYSKSLNQAMIIAYRKDYKEIDDKQHFIVVTFFPRGSKRAKRGTETIMLESYRFDDGPVYSDEFTEYMSELRENYGSEYEYLKEQTYTPECITLDDTKFDVIFCEDKLFQIADYRVIEID